MFWHKLLWIRFFRTLTISVLFFMLIIDMAWAQEKEMAALAPMGALGEFTEMEKQIIFNSLQESLSTHYALASQKAFEAALTQAFEELDYEECTEDQCFALIQQILQADNLFLFSMTREGNFTQLSLTRVNLDSHRLVRTDDCENCGIKQLNTKVVGLVLKIIEEDMSPFPSPSFRLCSPIMPPTLTTICPQKTPRWRHNMQTQAAAVKRRLTKVNMTATPLR